MFSQLHDLIRDNWGWLKLSQLLDVIKEYLEWFIGAAVLVFSLFIYSVFECLLWVFLLWQCKPWHIRHIVNQIVWALCFEKRNWKDSGILLLQNKISFSTQFLVSYGNINHDLPISTFSGVVVYMTAALSWRLGSSVLFCLVLSLDSAAIFREIAHKVMWS